MLVVVEFDLDKSGVEEPLDVLFLRSFLTEGNLVNSRLASLGSEALKMELYGVILFVITDGRVGSGVKPEVAEEGKTPDLSVCDKAVIDSGLSKFSLSGKSSGDGDSNVCCLIPTAVAGAIFLV